MFQNELTVASSDKSHEEPSSAVAPSYQGAKEAINPSTTPPARYMLRVTCKGTPGPRSTATEPGLSDPVDFFQLPHAMLRSASPRLTALTGRPVPQHGTKPIPPPHRSTFSSCCRNARLAHLWLLMPGLAVLTSHQGSPPAQQPAS